MLDLERRSCTAQLHIAVTTEDEFDYLAAIKTHVFQQNIAQLALAHQDCNIARGSAKHLRDGVATPLQSDLSADFSKAALGIFNGWK